MAIPVDAAGRVVASPKTKKIFGANGSPNKAVREAAQSRNEVRESADSSNATSETQSREQARSTGSMPSNANDDVRDGQGRERDGGFSSFWDSYWDDQRNKDLETAKDLDSMFGDGSANSVLSPTMTSRNTSIDQGTEYTPGEGETNRFGEAYSDSPANGNLNVGSIGSTRSNDMYEDLFLKDGMDPEDARLMHSGRRLLDGDTQIVSQTIDDGTLDYEHLTSPVVKGSQLKHYARSGLVPNMTIDQIEQIDPDRIYDKTQLASDYGYQPYVPDARTWVDMMGDSIVNIGTDLAGNVANFRNSVAEKVNPYSMTYDNGYDDTYDINGPMFDSNAYGYLSSINSDIDNNFDRFLSDPEKGLDVTYYNTTKTVNPKGETEYHFGVTPIETADDWNKYFDEESGTYSIPFSDGSIAVMTEDYAQNIGLEDAPYWLPNYVMEDGTSIPYNDVWRITHGRIDNDYDNDEGIRYNFSSLLPVVPENPIMLSNRPSYLQEQPLVVDDNGNIDFSNLMSNGADRVVDWTLGSLPIMLEQTQWPSSIANAMREWRGISSGSYDPVTRSYGMYNQPTDNVADDSMGMLMAGAIPVTESMVGPVGSAGSWTPMFFRDMLDGPGLARAIGRWFGGVNSEGFEEIAGNLFEELGEYGLSRAFGNYLDEDGNVVQTEAEAAKDENYNPIKQENSPMLDRLYNFGIPIPGRGGTFGLLQPDALARNLNAWIGGAAISGLPTALEEAGSSRQLANDAATEAAMLDMLGLNPYQEPSKMKYRVAPERYLEQFGEE